MRLLSIIVGAVYVSALWGQQQPSKLDELVAQALRGNPEILAAQKRYEAARQRPTQESTLPEPMFSLGYQSVGRPYPVAGIGKETLANVGVMVSQEFPFPGKLSLRGGMATKEAEAEFQQYQAVQLNVVSRLKQAYYRLYYACAATDVLNRERELLDNLRRVTEVRYTVGKAAQQDVFKAQTQFSIFETQLLRYQQERDSKEIEINALLNRPGAGRIEVPEEMATGELTATLDEMLAHARTQAPALAREQKVVERSDLAANLARKSYYPDYTVSGGYFNQGGLPPMWQFRVDFKLPAWLGRQRAEVSEQVFTASQARHDYEAADVGIQASIREEYTLAATARKLVELYQKSVIPEARLALESSIASYQTGTLDFLSLFSNFMNVVDYELMSHEELMRFHVALAKLEELTGM